MRSKLIITLLWMLTSLLTVGQEKSVTGDYFDFGLIAESVVNPMENLNTPQMEFAPAAFGNSLIYVYSDTEKKRVKREEDFHFRLKYYTPDQVLPPDLSSFSAIAGKGGIQGPCQFSADGKWLFITRNMEQAADAEDGREMKLGIFVYEWMDSVWIDRGGLAINSTSYNVCHPAWDDQDRRLIFASDMPGGAGKLDLYSMKQHSGGEWEAPRNLGFEVNSAGNDCFPFIYRGRFLFFSSDQEGGAGGLDQYVSVETGTQWLRAENMESPVNSPADDLSLMVWPDGRTIFFASSRPGGKGKDDLYRIDLPRDFTIRDPDHHTLFVYDSENKTGLSDAGVHIYKYHTTDPAVQLQGDRISGISYQIRPEDLKTSKEYRTNESGELYLSLEPGDYIIEAKNDQYHTRQALVSIPEGSQRIELGLEPIRCRSFRLRITDSRTGIPVDSAWVTWEENPAQAIAEPIGARFCVDPYRPFRAWISSKKYQSDSLLLTYTDIQEGQELIFQLKPVSAYVNGLPVKKGEVFILKNLLYEFDSYELNLTAKRELDSLVRHMKKFPGINIELSSHTDSRGVEMYNQYLSERRAGVAKEYLVKAGIRASRIAAVGYGESRLLNDCTDGRTCSEARHAENRRTEVKVIAAGDK